MEICPDLLSSSLDNENHKSAIESNLGFCSKQTSVGTLDEEWIIDNLSNVTDRNSLQDHCRSGEWWIRTMVLIVLWLSIHPYKTMLYVDDEPFTLNVNKNEIQTVLFIE